MKSILLTSIILSLLLFWRQAPQKESKPLTEKELVQQKLQERIDAYRNTKLKKCKSDAYKEAAKQVDSILIARARAERATQIERPAKPSKPTRPDKLQPKDNTEVKPLIEGN